MTTCEQLPLIDCEPTASVESTPSAAGSRARTSASRARVPAWTVSDPACGESMRAYLASFDPDTRSWKTSGLCGLEDLPTFSETLPRSGSMLSGTLYLLPPLVRLTSVIVSGSSPLLPTPTAQDSESAGGAGCIARGKRGHSLTSAARLIPTPTPTATEYGSNQGGAKRNSGPVRHSLQGMAQRGLLPTPCAEDHRNCADYSDGSRGHSPQLRHLGSGRLNPRFIAWMMGFPETWFDMNEPP